MPAIVRSEFALALNQVATERGIDPTVVVETIKAAILAAYRKDVPVTPEELELFTVELNPDNGEAKIFKEGKDVTPPGFGRIAAQTAKQVILQRIREAEKQAILTDFSAKVGSIVSGMILRFDGSNIIVDIGRAHAVMPPTEQITKEHYRLNQRLTFYIEGIRETYKGNEIIVSRTHKSLVAGLFKREVPEVMQGAVEIKEIAREAGNRSKVAVDSSQPGVDPVGSCVGQKGVRVQAVINELGGSEKVDIIQWSSDPVQFITAALAPAKDINVEYDERVKTAVAWVPEDQLSLAIGRDGQNVRLAAKLTGIKIDLKSKTPPAAASTTPIVVADDTSTVSAPTQPAAASPPVATAITETAPVTEAEQAATEAIKEAVAELTTTDKIEDAAEPVTVVSEAPEIVPEVTATTPDSSESKDAVVKE
ncbi:TPA: transcription termination/antitermination protein NusA [Patescibacteria group bacterium]|uniref:Transcription termination/antitermination protein NusA n=1 Tax=Candidatus Gottesmanbacteria bacterium GW2011_GWA1_43_11 TaxID=1618436 RepID=A0A0G1CF51_9BACT|nr:MAG: Transcription termination factor NusA [Candidatus Gottesmanbacteria bacterium GW2011_GWA1_43_11]HCS79440.1 transcription termination/antitermination protein NusA [Patescibacteria group bacterium]